MKQTRKQRSNPRHWIFTPRWFNPILYLSLVLAFFVSLFDGGIKEWWKESVDLVNNYVY